MQDIWQIICQKLVLITLCDHTAIIHKQCDGIWIIKKCHNDHPQEHQTFAIAKLTEVEASVVGRFNNEVKPTLKVINRWIPLDMAIHCITTHPELQTFIERVASCGQIRDGETFRACYTGYPRNIECLARSVLAMVARVDSTYNHQAILATKLFSDFYPRYTYRVYDRLQTPAVVQFSVCKQCTEEPIVYAVTYFLTRRGCKIKVLSPNRELEMSGTTASECVEKIAHVLEPQAMCDIIRREFASMM